MRHDVALAIGKSGPNVDVMCTDKDLGGRFMPFSKVSPGPLHCALFTIQTQMQSCIVKAILVCLCIDASTDMAATPHRL